MLTTLSHVLGLVLLFVGCAVALGSLVVGLPGTLAIIAIAVFYAWATGFATLHWSTIGWLALLAVVGEGVELVAAGTATAGTRAPRRVTVGALVGALVGGIIGAPFLFGIGALLGTLVGAFAGAALAVQLEGGSLRDSAATGFAAFKGRLLGFVLKTAIATLMVVVIGAAVL